MAETAFNKLVGAIKSRNWVSANEQFGGIMQQKVADRIQIERQNVGSHLVKESEEDEDVVITTDKADDKDDKKDDDKKDEKPKVDESSRFKKKK